MWDIPLPPLPYTAMEFQQHQDARFSGHFACDIADITENAVKAIMAPNESDLAEFAKKVKSEFADGFQWGDIGAIVGYTMGLLEDTLDVNSKREAVTKIIDIVIDMTDTPVLPDHFTDPLFKAMVHPLIDLAFNAIDGKVSFSDVTSADENVDTTSPITKSESKSFAEKLTYVFSNGFEWSDLSRIVALSIDYVSDFAEMDTVMKRQAIIDIMDYVIDMTDTPYLPDGFTDPIFKQLVPPFVDLILQMQTKKVASTGNAAAHIAGCPFGKKLLQVI